MDFLALGESRKATPLLLSGFLINILKISPLSPRHVVLRVLGLSLFSQPFLVSRSACRIFRSHSLRLLAGVRNPVQVYSKRQ